MTKTDRKTRILKLARTRPSIAASDVKPLGYGARDLWELARAGHLERIGRGRYRHPKARIHTHQDLLIVSNQVPDAVFCLLTALFLHNLGTQMPPAIWIALPTRARVPKLEGLGLEVVKMSPPLLTFGRQTKTIHQADLRLTSPAKTVADCFRYRSRIGTDVAIEALRDGLRKKLFTSDELYEAAKVDRVWNVIRPYAEALA